MLDYKNIKLAIAIPVSSGNIKVRTTYSLFKMMRSLPFEYDLFFKEGCLIHRNREILVETAINNKCSHILFIDSDMSFEKDSAVKLIERKKDIVGVNCYQRKLPLVSTVIISSEKKMSLTKENPEVFMTCDGLATGFLLINLEVFKKISKPWFFFELNKDGETITGEDYWFCEKAKKAGFDIWVDFSIPIKHIGDYLY